MTRLHSRTGFLLAILTQWQTHEKALKNSTVNECLGGRSLAKCGTERETYIAKLDKPSPYLSHSKKKVVVNTYVARFKYEKTRKSNSPQHGSPKNKRPLLKFVILFCFDTHGQYWQ
jgi:hypothetical protein